MVNRPRNTHSALYVVRRILDYARPYAPFLILGFLGVAGSQGLAIAIPGILRFVIDRGIAEQDREFMFAAGLLVVALGILRGLAGFLARYFTEAQSHRVAYDIRNEFYNKVQRLPFSYHDRAHTGSLITRGISDVDEIQRFLAFGVLDGLNTALIVIFATIMMFITSPVLAMIVILPLLPLILYSGSFASFVDREWRKVMEKLSVLGDHLQESIVGAEVVRAFARERYEIDRFADENRELFDQHMKVIRKWSNYIPFSGVMVAISTVLTLIFGAILVEQPGSGVTVGVVVQFNAYVLLMAQPIRFVGFVIMLVNQGIASGRRVFEVLDEPEILTDKPDAQPLPQVEGVVRFENVQFGYTKDGPLALEDITLEARPNDVVALMGHTGAGKSSLVNLIPRFYDVSGGRITVDGHDLRDVTLSSLRAQIGIVLQESLLFSATIRENIALGKPHSTDEEVIAAAKAANAHAFIMEFPDGYETLVGERGVTLSGGQRQRVAIARALLIDPRILILDDATSSVDTRTEALIQEALDRLMAGRTTFVVAQRMTTVLNASQILVLDHGRVAERGTHHELLAQDGLYKEIYDLQLADQEKVRRETMRLEDLADIVSSESTSAD
ncbi:MAG: ABC transporter ATP-binding protein [Anaerolineales bacterium]